MQLAAGCLDDVQLPLATAAHKLLESARLYAQILEKAGPVKLPLPQQRGFTPTFGEACALIKELEEKSFVVIRPAVHANERYQSLLAPGAGSHYKSPLLLCRWRSRRTGIRSAVDDDGHGEANNHTRGSHRSENAQSDKASLNALSRPSKQRKVVIGAPITAHQEGQVRCS